MMPRSFVAAELLETVLGFTALQAALALLAMSLASLAGGVAASRFGCRTGTTPLVLLGVGVALTGLAWFSYVVPIALCLASIAMPSHDQLLMSVALPLITLRSDIVLSTSE